MAEWLKAIVSTDRLFVNSHEFIHRCSMLDTFNNFVAFIQSKWIPGQMPSENDLIVAWHEYIRCVKSLVLAYPDYNINTDY